ncbi:hypothetical protein H0H93_009556 [Arthromyces matolae]|nr:hypothetical protein H0H93_009556 [Arthromyces matolae]
MRLNPKFLSIFLFLYFVSAAPVHHGLLGGPAVDAAVTTTPGNQHGAAVTPQDDLGVPTVGAAHGDHNPIADAEGGPPTPDKTFLRRHRWLTAIAVLRLSSLFAYTILKALCHPQAATDPHRQLGAGIVDNEGHTPPTGGAGAVTVPHDTAANLHPGLTIQPLSGHPAAKPDDKTTTSVKGPSGTPVHHAVKQETEAQDHPQATGVEGSASRDHGQTPPPSDASLVHGSHPNHRVIRPPTGDQGGGSPNTASAAVTGTGTGRVAGSP